MAPSMERSMSSLGIDGWTTAAFKSTPAKKEMDSEMVDEKMDGYPDEATIQVCNELPQYEASLTSRPEKETKPPYMSMSKCQSQ